jgi:hypothetical protein
MNKYLIFLFSTLLIFSNNGFYNTIKVIGNGEDDFTQILLLNNSNEVLDTVICNHKNYSIDTINRILLILDEVTLFGQNKGNLKSYYFTTYNFDSNKFNFERRQVFRIICRKYADADAYGRFLRHNVKISNNKVTVISGAIKILEFQLNEKSLRRIFKTVKYHLLYDDYFKESYRIHFRINLRYHNKSKMHHNLYLNSLEY